MDKQKPTIFDDEKYLLCISLARLSKNDRRWDERYGSVLIKDGEIIGRGFNRAVSHPKFRLDRKIRQGWTNHAEIEAINDAFSRGIDVANSDLYVAGYFFKTGYLFLQKKYTCNRCPTHLRNYDIDNIHIPSPSGWIKKAIALAEEEAAQLKGNVYRGRQRERIGRYTIEMLGDKLLTPEQLGF